MNSLPAFG